jgi:hypothetical protein
MIASIKRWWERRQYRKYLVQSIMRTTDTDQAMRLHDRLRDFDEGGDGKYKPPADRASGNP